MLIVSFAIPWPEDESAICGVVIRTELEPWSKVIFIANASFLIIFYY